ncbi:LTA synthase family protein [Zunongwangia sp. SCSIO 43204]|uniref:LTA synthase family protein n=1 Tax=Zunongwangia sp. SCSIO 43204 TaxID=2779359 RepID=UPI001CA82C8B|nr:LTA synthase family protein [Zunongwangia sp. SCSIO 43204]UAB83999.1 LTA synthase family protein [Zunongwangia sp. SCSIO 43204]
MSQISTFDHLSFREKLINATRGFFSISLVWLLLLFLLSILELLYNTVVNSVQENFFNLLMYSCWMDILLWLKWGAICYLFYIIFYVIHPKSAKAIFKTFICIAAVIQTALVLYFTTSLNLLGADLFSYSLEDVQQTLGASGGLSFVAILQFLVVIAICISILWWVPRFIKLPWSLGVVYPIASVIIFFTPSNSAWSQISLQNTFASNLVTNKSDYFFTSSYYYFFPKTDYDVDIYADNYIGIYDNLDNSIVDFEYLDESNYPFYHVDADTDVLSPYFNLNEKKPNVVIILVEGLGRAFTNKGAYLGNWTPFLDSLSTQSLYWKNFLSQGGRTFAVLPSILGSLPFAQSGYLGMGEQMPKQLSLLNLLKHNGYETSFYYGGDASFDNMALYLRRNKIDDLIDKDEFSTNEGLLPETNGFTWGYDDEALYAEYLKTRPSDSAAKPQLGVLLTVSSHNPFKINHQQEFYDRFEERMTQLEFTDAKKQDYRSYRDQYASILYTDEMLKKFFENFKKRPDFENTIFLITGDHRMPEIPMATVIDRYHVPLIMYSPMLSRTSEMASISSHYDVTPSLLRLLKSNYTLDLPDNTSWLGKGLDTVANFRNIHQIPLIQTKVNMKDYVVGNYHLNGDRLYEILENMGTRPVNDPEQQQSIMDAYNGFKQKNAIITNGGKIIPDSIYVKYTN